MSNKDNKSTVCIIILNQNEKNLLKNSLRNVFSNTRYENFDVVVVDNGSTDGSVDLVQTSFPQASVISNEQNLGFSIGNNIGIYASGDYDYYLLLNNDTEVHENWLTEMLQTAQRHEKVGLIGAKLLYPDDTVQHAGGVFDSSGDRHIGRGENPEKFSSDREVDYITGAAFLIKKDLVEQIGFLDEILSPIYYEDIDYCRRAAKAGFKIYLSASAVVVHHESKTTSKNNIEQNYFIKRKNCIKYLILNETGRTFLFNLLREVKYPLAAMMNYKNNSLRILLKAYKEVLIDLPKLMHKRYDRSEYVPSYYCIGSKDYSLRYH